MNYYNEIALNGLEENEAERIEHALANSKHNKALVIGCGTGREVFALSEKFTTIYGVDTCAPMIKSANKIKQAESLDNCYFTLIQDLDDLKENDFDFIYLTVTLMNHMKGRQNRVNFYNKLKQKLTKDGVLCGFSNIMQLKRTHHFYWVSQMIRLKTKLTGETWEPGDSARSYLGHHSKINFPIFYHFDQSQEHIIQELRDANLSAKFVFSNFWQAQ